jgi:hypothetical protein
MCFRPEDPNHDPYSNCLIAILFAILLILMCMMSFYWTATMIELQRIRPI